MRHAWRRKFGMAVAAILVAAPCAATTIRSQQVRDSAGVRELRYGARDRPASRWQVDATPILSIGGAAGEGAAEFAAVMGVVRLRDGSVVVANQSTNELRVFAPDGTHRRTMGRRGRGPGEFDRLSQLMRIGDTVVGIDQNRRGEAFAPDGKLVRSLPIPLFDAGQFPSYVGSLHDGASVLLALDPPGDTTRSSLTATGALGIRTSSGATRTLAHIPMYETQKLPMGYVPVFLGPVYRAAVLSDRTCVGWAARWEVTCFARGGAVKTRTIRATSPGPVTDDDKRVFREGFMRANRSVPRDQIEATVRSLPFADRRSAYGRFVPATTGELWVGEFVISEEVFLGRTGLGSPDVATTWSVLAPDGRWIADVKLPARFALLDAGDDYVAGVLRDDDDVESVVVYRLRR